MVYPQRQEYIVSIRNPQFAFKKIDPITQTQKDLDPILVKGRPIETENYGYKEPLFSSGKYAVAFQFETDDPHKIWAVRCFTRELPNVLAHYQNILKYIRNCQYCRSYFVEFNFLQEGIMVKRSCYPIVKMEWFEGQNLKEYIKNNLENPENLEKLANSWIDLSKNFLKDEIAHGDLQHENILISDSGNLTIKLVDYDTLYFASQQGNNTDDIIKGYPGYQHPLRESLNKQSLQIDFFSQLIIYISIVALSKDKNLWYKYNVDNNDYGLLFWENDFKNTDRQDGIFKDLMLLSPELSFLSWELKKICELKDFYTIPSLEEVLANCNITNREVWNPNRSKKNSNPHKLKDPFVTLNRDILEAKNLGASRKKVVNHNIISLTSVIGYLFLLLLISGFLTKLISSYFHNHHNSPNPNQIETPSINE